MKSKRIPTFPLTLIILFTFFACQNNTSYETVSQHKADSVSSIDSSASLNQLTTKKSSDAIDLYINKQEKDWIYDSTYEPAPEVFPTFTPRKVDKKITWKIFEEGLAYAEFDAPIKSNISDSKISVLKVNPRYFKLDIFSSREQGIESQPAPQWIKAEKLIAAFNASMFQMEGMSAGYMKDYEFINNPDFTPKYNSIAAFNLTEEGKNKGLPMFQIIDIDDSCGDWKEMIKNYHSLIQNLRLVDCKRKNRWGNQKRYWSMVVLAEDNQGNALFVYTRSPYNVQMYNDMLLDSELNIKKIMYLEGGPETSFFLNYADTIVAKQGSYETGFYTTDGNDYFWNIPNVIGITKRK